MSNRSTDRELGVALKHLPVEELVRSFLPTEEILRLGKQMRSRRRATLAATSSVAAACLVAGGISAVNGAAKPQGQTLSSQSVAVSSWAARGDLTTDPRLAQSKAAWERAGARDVHVLFAGHLPELGTPVVVLSEHVGATNTIRLVQWRPDVDVLLEKAAPLPPGQDYITIGVSDEGNRLAFTYGPDGKPNTPVSQVGALHVLVLASPDRHTAEYIGQQTPKPLTEAEAGVLMGSFGMNVKPASVALDGAEPHPVYIVVQA